MDFILREETCGGHGLTRQEALLLACYSESGGFVAARQALVDKGLVTASYDGRNNGDDLRPTARGYALMLALVQEDKLPEDKGSLDDGWYMETARLMREVYPKGVRPGTRTHWTEGVAVIARRLRLFVRKYGMHGRDEMVDATRRYVAGFDGDFRYMRTLRYFIFKEKLGVSSEIEGDSLLLEYMEDKDDGGDEMSGSYIL